MDEMNIMSKQMLKLILRRKWLILSITLLFLFLGAVYQFFVVKPMYRETIPFSFSQQGNDNRIFNVINFANSQLRTDAPPSAPALDTEEIVAKFKKNLKEDTELLTEIQQISPNYKTTTTAQLPGIIQTTLIPNSKTINLSVTSPSKENADQLAEVVSRHFEEFVYEENFKSLNKELVSLKRYLDLNISLLNKHIERANKDVSTMKKTVNYGSAIIEPNPEYDVFLENIAEDRILLNMAQVQLEEIGEVEKLLPQLAKETGIMVMADATTVQKSPSNLMSLLKVILAGIAGFIFSLFVVLLLGNFKPSKS